MTFADLTTKLGKFTADNSPSILTALAVTGSLATAYLTGRASFKAAQMIDDVENDYIHNGEKTPIHTREKVDLVWKLFIPAAGSAVMTVVCVIGANQINSRRAAAVAAAYSVLDRGFTEYREKVIDKIGEKKEQVVRDEIAQDRINQNPPVSREIILTGGETLCKDEWSGRYFKSTMEEIKKAQNDTVYQILSDNYASLNDFYRRIGLSTTGLGDEMGWNLDRRLDIEFSVALSEDQKPCLSINFNLEPIRGYHRVN